MEFDTLFPADREAFELVEQGEGLLGDWRSLPRPLMFGEPLRGDQRLDAAASQLMRTAFE